MSASAQGRQLGLFDASPEDAPENARTAPSRSRLPERSEEGASGPFVPIDPPSAETSLSAAALAFDAHLQRLAKTENTRRAFASDLRLLAEHLGDDRPVGRIQRGDLEGFLDWLLRGRDKPCSPKSLSRRITTLKIFFAWLVDAGARADDPAARLVHRKVLAKLPRVLSDGEVQSLLASAARLRRGSVRADSTGSAAKPGDPRPALLVRLLLDTGLKKGEISRLLVDDLALDARPPSLLVRYDEPRFASKERRVPFGPAVAPLVADYSARYLPGRRLFDCTPRNLEYVLGDLLRQSGLPAEEIGFETLRWTAALRAWRAGVEAATLRQMLGLSPITWVDTQRRLELLADTVGPRHVSRYFD